MGGKRGNVILTTYKAPSDQTLMLHCPSAAHISSPVQEGIFSYWRDVRMGAGLGRTAGNTGLKLPMDRRPQIL